MPMSERISIIGHRLKPGTNSQSIDGGKFIDCTCGDYTGQVVKTWPEARDLFKKHIERVRAGEPEPKKPWER